MLVREREEEVEKTDLTIKEISKMLEKADQGRKIAILLMCSSRIRIGHYLHSK
jgi:hypothetical protein